MFNKIILVGNLTRDIELRYTQSGSAIASTAIATSRKFTSNGEKKEEVCFVDITFFGRSAEVANQYLRKGSKILVEGRLKLDTWQDQGGQNRQKHSVVVESMQMLDSRNDNQSSNAQANEGYQQPQAPQPQQYQQQTQPAQSSNGEANQGYQQPATAYQPQNMQQNTQQQQPPSNQRQLPEIDIDEGEIPF